MISAKSADAAIVKSIASRTAASACPVSVLTNGIRSMASGRHQDKADDTTRYRSWQHEEYLEK